MLFKTETNGELCEIVCDTTGYVVENIEQDHGQIKIFTKYDGYFDIGTPPQHPESADANMRNNILTISLKIDPEADLTRTEQSV